MKNKVYSLISIVLLLMCILCSCEKNSEYVSDTQYDSEADSTDRVIIPTDGTEANKYEENTESEDTDNYTKFY